MSAGHKYPLHTFGLATTGYTYTGSMYAVFKGGQLCGTTHDSLCLLWKLQLRCWLVCYVVVLLHFCALLNNYWLTFPYIVTFQYLFLGAWAAHKAHSEAYF